MNWYKQVEEGIRKHAILDVERKKAAKILVERIKQFLKTLPPEAEIEELRQLMDTLEVEHHISGSIYCEARNMLFEMSSLPPPLLSNSTWAFELPKPEGENDESIAS